MSFKKLLVKNFMIKLPDCPIINASQILKVAIEKMDEHRLGIINILDNDNNLKGIITDGDLRRILLRNQKPLSAILVDDAIKFCISNPLTTNEDQSLIDSINLMNSRQIWDLPVLGSDNNLVGLLHLHTAIKNYIDALENE